MIVLHPEFDAPPGWTSRTAGGTVQLVPPDVEAAMMLVFPAASGTTPVGWVENLLRGEARAGFQVLEYAPRRELASKGGLPGVVVELTGGFSDPGALVERRVYVVFADGKALFPFGLHASVATFERVAEPFFAAALSVRRPAPR